jgi:hypothetical protein
MAGSTSRVGADARVRRARLGRLSSDLGVGAEAIGRRCASGVLDREGSVGISVACHLRRRGSSGER